MVSLKSAREDEALLSPCCFVFDPIGEHAFLSNFAITPFEHEGKVWPSVEHFYQAAKFRDAEVKLKILRAISAEDAKMLAWKDDHSPQAREDWDDHREAVMRLALRLKFDQCKAAQNALIATWPRPILEDSPHDSFWGIGKDGNGENTLGRLLEEQRCLLSGLPNLYVRLEPRPELGRGGASETRWAWVRKSGAVMECQRFRGHLAYSGFQGIDICKELKTGDQASHTSRFEYHAALLDAKYSSYRWTEDARSVVSNWRTILDGVLSQKIKKPLAASETIVVGAGAANETANLWQRYGRNVTLIDWGRKLVENCRAESPNAIVLRRRAEKLSDVETASKDIYCSLRTFDSALIDTSDALREARRVIRPGGLLALSVSDGYLLKDGTVARGQIGPTGEINRDIPWERLLKLAAKAELEKFSDFGFFDLVSEVGFIAIRSR